MEEDFIQQEGQLDIEIEILEKINKGLIVWSSLNLSILIYLTLLMFDGSTLPSAFIAISNVSKVRIWGAPSLRRGRVRSYIGYKRIKQKENG